MAIASSLHLSSRVAGTRTTTIDGLTAFAPIWGAATLFSLAASPNAFLGRDGSVLFGLSWLAAAASFGLLFKPRELKLLYAVAALMVARYAWTMPVASNNKTMAVFMNAAILTISMHAFIKHVSAETLRGVIYEQMRVVARGLLAVMYFYGVFHKINSDFLDPQVSCAVSLYTPLAQGFGLGDNLYGKYLAIWSTLIVETITMICLYWKRYFAIGLLFGLAFHFIIPISAFSWYMDFSSLVLALYVLSVPGEVSRKFYAAAAVIFRSLRERFGEIGTALPPVLLMAGAVLLSGVFLAFHPHQAHPGPHLYRSAWILMWTAYGAVTMVMLASAALDHLPWRGVHGPRQPLWLYLFPATLFIQSLSPYAGLKTESSIAMFSNLRTEGGVTNHYVITRPPYLFDYQDDVARLVASSNPQVQEFAKHQEGMVMFALQEYLRKHPREWITYTRDGKLFEKVTYATLTDVKPSNWLERHVLIFKPVEYRRPQVCTH